ncbi:MAG TPA: hypothetical protein EYP58_01255 [bacterium (Candidatus Stahlbacteria)]|nr:hypothetical protein [Candidatus Stahlbacteria bacterium]
MDTAVRSLEFQQVLGRIAHLAESRNGKDAIHNLRPGLSLEELERSFEAIEEGAGFLHRVPEILIPELDLGRPIYSGEELFGTLSFLNLVAEIKKLPVRKDGELGRLIGRLNPLQRLRDELTQVFDEGGNVRDDASSELARLRKLMVKVHDQLINALGRIINRNSRILNNDQIMRRGGRFVICVKQALRKELKGVVHDISDSGHSVFVEPEDTIEDQNLLEELRIKERREIERIFRTLSKKLHDCRDSIEIDLNVMIHLDTILARARYAKEKDCTRPDLNNEGKIRIKKGRHPILEEVKKTMVVPLNLQIDSGILIVTGPNAGGKTILLKTVGLLTLMANSGIFVPAAYGTTLPVVDKIYAKIGDEQSIESSLSSFGAQIEIVKHLLSEATPQSLVLLDELGSNTSPAEGGALACAILEGVQSIGCPCIATTHSEDIKTFAYQREGFRIGAMGYNGRPTYQFQADYFAPSCAFVVAEKMGLSEQILNRARELVDTEKGRFEELTARLAAEISELDEKKKTFDRELAELSRMKNLYETRLEEIEDWKRRERREFDRRLKKILRNARSEVERLIARLSTEGPKRDLIKNIRARIDTLQPVEQSEPSREFAIGARVEVNGEIGEIVERKKDQYLVALGRIRCWIHGSQLKERERSSDIPELHLRGRRRDEVAYLLDRFIGDALAQGDLVLRIIHGRGQGIVKQEVDSFLRKDKRVKEFGVDPLNPGQMQVRLYG